MQKLTGNCIFCGHLLPQYSLHWDAHSGTLAFRGKQVHINPSQSVLMTMLIQVYPGYVRLNDLREKYLRGLKDGGPATPQAVYMLAANLKATLREKTDLRIASPANGLYALTVKEGDNEDALATAINDSNASICRSRPATMHDHTKT